MTMMLSLLQTSLELNIGETAEAAELAGASNTFGEWVGIVLAGILTISALLLLLNLVWAGIDWISAGGDSGKIEKARSKITQSIVGIIVLASAVAIFNLVQNFLGIELLQFQAGPRENLDRTTDRIQQLRDAATGSSGSNSNGGSSGTNNPINPAIGQPKNRATNVDPNP